MKIVTTTLLSLLFVCSNCLAQSDWTLNKEKDGIKVYTRTADSSAFKYVKVECILEGSWEKLSAILYDIKLQPKWVYHSKKTYLIKKINSNEVLYYTQTSLPWPVNDRDAVVRMKLYYDEAGKVYKVVSTNEPKELPTKKGIVRVQQYKATWDVKKEGSDKIEISYILEVHPGGTVPAWVVNMFVTKGPFETFNKLAELLKS